MTDLIEKKTNLTDRGGLGHAACEDGRLGVALIFSSTVL
jgi:hypothetical protein